MPRLSKKERRQVLIKSAIQVFSEKNYQVAKVADITKVAHVSEPVLYHHFASKKALYLEVLQIILEQTIIQLDNAAKKGQNALEKLTYVFNRYIYMLESYQPEIQVQFQAFS